MSKLGNQILMKGSDSDKLFIDESSISMNSMSQKVRNFYKLLI